MPPPSEHMAQWGAPVFIFPNTFMFPMYANCLCYRMRPYDDVRRAHQAVHRRDAERALPHAHRVVDDVTGASDLIFGPVGHDLLTGPLA